MEHKHGLTVCVYQLDVLENETTSKTRSPKDLMLKRRLTQKQSNMQHPPSTYNTVVDGILLLPSLLPY